MSRKRFSGITEKIGLDWIPIVIGISTLEDINSPPSVDLAQIRRRFSNVEDEKKLNYAVKYCDHLVEREDDRSDKIESKAFTLIGITGIATGFITGFAGLLLERGALVSSWVLILSASLYVLVAISLIMTILLAVRVIVVGDYRFSYPSAKDILNLSRTTLNYFKREYAASLFYSYNRNAQIVNRKATYLGGSQLWFRNSIILLLLLTFALAGYTFLTPPPPLQGTSPAATPTVDFSMIATPTQTSTLISQPTSTPVHIPSDTPLTIVTTSP